MSQQEFVSKKDNDLRPWSRRLQAFFHLLDGRLYRASAQLVAEFTGFAHRVFDHAFVFAIEGHGAVYICQRYAVVLGGCLRPIVQCQVATK